MADSVADARQEVENARRAAAAELDQLGPAVREAADIPAKIRRNPLKSAGLLGGATFLAVGGPRRLLKAGERRFLPSRANRVPSLLPRDIERTLGRLGEPDEERARAHLERDFRAYLEKHHPDELPNARRSFWKTYDLIIGIVGGVATRELLKRFMTAPKEAEAEGARHEAEAKEQEAEAARHEREARGHQRSA
jgi:hypothetical protein